MFSPRKRPLLLVAERLQSLRLSLNTPVLSTPELPAGPARAAIAVHLEGGRRCFTVVVRSLRDGTSVLYELEGEEIDDESSAAVALDAALSFGESMGFLFDDEVVTDRGAETLRHAVASLRELVAAPEPEEEGVRSAVSPADDPEILLEEALEAEAGSRARAAKRAPAPIEPAAPAARSAAAQPPAVAPESPGSEPVEGSSRLEYAAIERREVPAPRATLTKFRGSSLPASAVVAAGGTGRKPPPSSTEPGPAPRKRVSAAGQRAGAAPGQDQAASSEKSAPRPRTVAAPGGGALLGRVRPVRLRASDGPPPPSPLLRLLSAF